MLRITRDRNGRETLHYPKNTTTQDCIDILSKRINKRYKELTLYKMFYDKYLSLSKKQKTDLEWLNYLREHPNILD